MDENMHVFCASDFIHFIPSVLGGGGGEGLVNYFTTKPT